VMDSMCIYSKVMTTDSNGNKRASYYRQICASFNGPPEDGQTLVRHMCNDARCINPTHLQWGTPSENGRDGRDVQSHEYRLTRSHVIMQQLDLMQALAYDDGTIFCCSDCH